MRYLIAFVAVVLLAAGCSDNNHQEKQRSAAVKQRSQTYDRAVAQVPTPNVTSFPRRETLVEAVKRQSLTHHPWYVYVLGLNGNIVNYFVAKSVPVNDCDYLSSTEQIIDSHGESWQIGAPSLEGIYQSSSGCDTLTFFDLGTNAEIQVSRSMTFITDRPLKVDAEAIKVRK